LPCEPSAQTTSRVAIFVLAHAVGSLMGPHQVRDREMTWGYEFSACREPFRIFLTLIEWNSLI